MRYLFTIILFLIVATCFAIDQESIDGFEAYEATMAEAHRIAETAEASRISSAESKELWHKMTDYDLPTEIRTVAKNKLEDNKKLVDRLWTQYYELRAKADKLEPLRDEYYRQKHIEDEREQILTSIIGLTLFLILCGIIIRFIIIQHRKFQRKYQCLLEEGKITQEEYDHIMEMASNGSPVFHDDYRTNPATGIRMGLGGCDAGGNPYGSSFRNSSSCSDNYKTRWD